MAELFNFGTRKGAWAEVALSLPAINLAFLKLNPASSIRRWCWLTMGKQINWQTSEPGTYWKWFTHMEETILVELIPTSNHAVNWGPSVQTKYIPPQGRPSNLPWGINTWRYKSAFLHHDSCQSIRETASWAVEVLSPYWSHKPYDRQYTSDFQLDDLGLCCTHNYSQVGSSSQRCSAVLAEACHVKSRCRNGNPNANTAKLLASRSWSSSEKLVLGSIQCTRCMPPGSLGELAASPAATSRSYSSEMCPDRKAGGWIAGQHDWRTAREAEALSLQPEHYQSKPLYSNSADSRQIVSRIWVLQTWLYFLRTW